MRTPIASSALLAAAVAGQAYAASFGPDTSAFALGNEGRTVTLAGPAGPR